MKNDITYEYRVFTNKLIDIESMEVGKCTSKVIKELKQKDKVDSRFFHTSDTDEWFFCWNGELQKLNLKGDSDVNAALAEVRELINKAEVSVENANKTAEDANAAAESAQNAAREANAAVESIGNKADKSDVEILANKVSSKAEQTDVDTLLQTVDTKADKTIVDDLVDRVDGIKVPSLDGYATEKFVGDEIKKIDIPTKVSELENDVNYLTEHQSLVGYATEKWVGEQGYLTEIPTDYLTKEKADELYAPSGSTGSGSVDLSSYATKEFVGVEISKIDIPTKVSELENDRNYLTEHQDISGKQDKITDLDVIRENAELGATALRSIPEEYITETELNNKKYLTEQYIANYYTKGEIDDMIGSINNLVGNALTLTDTILNA